MNILFLDQFSTIGGAQLGLVDVAEPVKERGWNPHVLLPGGGPLTEKLRSRGIGVDEIACGPYQSGSKNVGDFVRFAFDVRQQKRAIESFANRLAADLVYVNGPRLLPAAALASYRGPVIFHAHSRLQQGYARRLAGWSIRRVDATVVACSKFVADSLLPYVRSGRLCVVPNGTRDMGFRERPFGAARSWRLGMIGRISPEKGQAEFLQAIQLLAPVFPTARFVICGAPGPTAGAYLDRVSTLARGLPVEFIGWRDDVGRVLAELDLLVVPSKDEGMGRVIVEAFSAGVPVVAFAIGGIPEVVTHGETGFLVTERTPAALADQISQIISSDPEMLRRVVARARQAWERSYRIAVYQHRIMSLMEQTVSTQRAKGGAKERPPRTGRLR